MSAFFRTSRNTGVSLPFWLAIPVALVALVIWLAVVIYGLAAMLIVFSVRTGARAWRAHQARRAAG